MSSKSVIFLTFLIFLCLLPFYLYRLDFPGLPVWDEQYHVPAARSYLEGNPARYRNLRNPPLGKELIAVSIYGLGDQARAHRLPSALAAAGVGALLFLGGLYLLGRWEGGLLSLLFWLSSPLAYLHARLAMLDMPTAFFYTAGLVAFLPLLKNPQRPRPWAWIAAASALVALGSTVKVLVLTLFPLYLIALFLLRREIPLRRSLALLASSASLSLLLAWSLVYGLLGFSPAEIPRQLELMYRLQSTPHKDYAGLSGWQDWFLGRGSLWFHSEKTEDGRRFSALCTNNPLLWIPGALAGTGLLLRGLLGQPLAVYLGLAVPLQILFWLLLKSQWILTYGLPMEPVFCLAIPYALNQIFEKKPGGRAFTAIWSLCLAAAAGFYFVKVWPQVLGFFRP